MKSSSPSPQRILLKTHGLRVTAARVAVLRVLAASSRPMTHGEVVDVLQSEQNEMDRTTVYRNLVSLSDAGIVRRTELGDRLWRFELADEDHTHAQPTHPHFVCTDCGTVECLPQSVLPAQPKRREAELPASLRRGDVEIQIRGRCDECLGEI